jgi:hypothetical protein
LFSKSKTTQLMTPLRRQQSRKIQWKRISHKQSARWQRLSQLKVSAFSSLNVFVKKCNNLQLGLVMPSIGRYSPIET